MFHYTTMHWVTFLTAAFLLDIAPGPDMAFILGQTARYGKRGGWAAMFGAWTGTFIHVVLAAAGLSVILATSALVFGIVKWVGALYLVWLGVRALLSHGEALVSDTSDGEEAAGWFSIYSQGVFVSALNPKVAIFFLAFLPQFVVEGAGPVSGQLFLHGVLIIAMAGLIEPFLVLFGAYLAQWLKRDPRVGLWLDRSVGALLIGLGLRLVVGE